MPPIGTLVCMQAIMFGGPCELRHAPVPPTLFVYGPAVDLHALENARHITPPLPTLGPIIAFRPEAKPKPEKKRKGPAPVEKAVARTVRPAGAAAPEEEPKARGLLASLFGQPRGLENLTQRAIERNLLKNPKALYVKADGNEVMGCAEKNKFLMGVLAAAKKKWGKTPIVNSAYRSPTHNKRVKGAKNSYHMSCRALDIRVPGVKKDTLAKWLRAYPGMGGVGIYKSAYVHFDNGRRRDWDWR